MGNAIPHPMVITSFIQNVPPNHIAVSHAVTTQAAAENRKIFGIISNKTAAMRLSLLFRNSMAKSGHKTSKYIARPKPLITASMANPAVAAVKKYGISWCHSAKVVGGEVVKNAAVAVTARPPTMPMFEARSAKRLLRSDHSLPSCRSKVVRNSCTEGLLSNIKRIH